MKTVSATPHTVNASSAQTVRKVAFAGIFAAITFVVFTYLSIPIPTVGGGKVTVHLGNAFCVLGTLLLGTAYGSIGGALGLTIADLIDPVYIVQAPITFVIKLIIGLITGTIAHRIYHLKEEQDKSRLLIKTIAASAAGLAFNAVFDPLIRYYYKILILGRPAAEVSLTINVVVTLINSVVSLFIAVALYMALRPALRKAGLDL